jgi:hypothetical protein
MWMKWEPIIHQLRIQYKQPETYSNFEYLADEMKRIRQKRGITEKLPDTFTKYIPELTT